MGLLAIKRNYGRVRKESNQDGCYRCSKCKEWKQPSQFNRNKSQTSGLHYACKLCMRAQSRKYNLPAKYGITSGEFSKKLLLQESKCACCDIAFEFDGKPSLRPCVDHNHQTDEVRDLLCGKCNLAAGNVGDSSDKALKLANYLKKWNC